MNAATRWLPFALGALAAGAYALLAPPSFYWLDAAELSASGVGLGSPHPTGFPLYMMMVKVASLVPIGELAHRVNLLSAVCAGVTIGLVARLVIEAGRGKAAGLAGAVIAAAALGCGLLFARHAVVAEVYVPTAMLFAAMLLCLDRAARDRSGRLGLILALVCGLGLGLHSSFRLLAALPVIAFAWMRLRAGQKWPLYAPMIAIGVGAALHLYLPIRSVSQTALDWGHPKTAGALIDHVSAARIRDSFDDKIASSTPEVVGVNLRDFASSVFDGLGPAALLLAAIGLVWLGSRRRSRYLAVALGLAVLIDFVYSFWINPMGISDGQNGALLAVAVAALAGLGSAWFLARSQRAAPFIGAFVAVLVAFGPAWVTARALGAASRSNAPRAVADAALDQLPPRAIALTRSDSLSAATLFLTTAEGARPDVAVVVRQHLLDAERTRAVVGLAQDAPPTLQSLAQTGRPIGWEVGDDALPGPMAATVDLPFVRLGRQQRIEPGAGADIADIEAAVSRARSLWADGSGDPLAQRHLAAALTNLGRLAFGRGRLGFAAKLFDAAIIASPKYASALVNRGVVASRIGDLEGALEFTKRALDSEPNRVSALINAARYERALGRTDSARRRLDRALAVEPGNRKALAEREGLPHR